MIIEIVYTDIEAVENGEVVTIYLRTKTNTVKCS